jgi:plastocyanin
MAPHAGSFPRRRLALLALLLGFATVTLPAIAGSETTPTVNAVNAGAYSHYWSPSKATVAVGGQVTFSNSTEVAHGVEWLGTVKPVCEEGEGKVPVGSTPSASAANWSGNCTFSQPGTYNFYCTVHGAEMRGSITVTSAGTTTTTTTPTTTTTATPTSPTTPTGATTPAGSSPTLAQLLAGSVARAVRVAHRQHGAVRGSVALSTAAAGGRLEVDLLARRASLASASGGKVRVGRLVRRGLHAGTVRFAVTLDRRARGALRRHGRLALTVRVVLTPARGASRSVTRAIIVVR